jgi:homoserine dehydrogenase
MLQESHGTKIVLSKVLVKDVAKYSSGTPANYTSDINDLLSDDTDLVIDASNNSEINWSRGALTELAKAGKSVVVLNKPLLATSTQVFAELEKTYGVKFLIGACISKNSPINVSTLNYLFDGNERFEERGHSSDQVCRAIFEEILYFYNK